MNVVPAQKRKRDDTGGLPDVVSRKRHLGSLLRESIALATASDMDDASLDPLLDNLSSALHLSCTPSTTEWNWTMDAKTVLGMDAGDRLVLAEMVGSRAQMERAGILVKPQNWNVAGEPVDWRTWIVHLPGLPLTHWAGGVFTATIHFQTTPGELKPRDVFPTKIRSVRPLFHPNNYPSGTWSLLNCFRFEEIRGKIKQPLTHKHESWETDEEDRLYRLLHALQRLFEEHDIENPAQSDAYTCARNTPQEYYERIRKQTLAWTPDPVTGVLP